MSELLPEELVHTILARQSSKNLARFKCVCKSWRDLINSRYFADIHRDISPTKFVLYDDKYRNMTPTEFESFHDKGLFLLAIEDTNPVIANPIEIHIPFDQFAQSKRRSSYWHERSINESTCVLPCEGTLCVTLKNHNLMVCDPSSKQFKILPPGEYTDASMLGFGYDSVNDDYKIVMFRSPDMVEIETACVFEFKTSSWRKVVLIPKPDWYYRERIGTFLNQCIYWIAYYRSNGDRFVLCFNISTHEYHKMPLPVCNKGVMSSWLGVTTQKLSIADYDRGKHEISISVLEKTGKWNMIKSFSMLNLISAQDLPRYQIDFVSFTKKNDIFVSVTVEGAKKKVLLCKTGEKTLKQIPYCNSVAGFRFLGEYVETPVIDFNMFMVYNQKFMGYF